MSAPGTKKSSGYPVQPSGRELGHSSNRLEEDDSFDEGIDDILAQVPIFVPQLVSYKSLV